LTPLPIALVVAGAFCGCRRQPDRAPPAAERAQPAAATTAPAPSGLPRLVDLGAGKCIPCKLMAPILEELKSNTVGRLEVQFIDVWKNPDAGAPYAIRMIPTQIFYGAGGKELFRHEGFFSLEDILAKWKELGVELASTNAPATR
jgi:thioredoxin 1